MSKFDLQYCLLEATRKQRTEEFCRDNPTSCFSSHKVSRVKNISHGKTFVFIMPWLTKSKTLEKFSKHLHQFYLLRLEQHVRCFDNELNIIQFSQLAPSSHFLEKWKFELHVEYWKNMKLFLDRIWNFKHQSTRCQLRWQHISNTDLNFIALTEIHRFDHFVSFPFCYCIQ